MALAQTARSAKSPFTRSKSSPARPRKSLAGRSSAFTRCPRAISSWTRFAPMKPEAPVTKQFIIRRQVAQTCRTLQTMIGGVKIESRTFPHNLNLRRTDFEAVSSRHGVPGVPGVPGEEILKNAEI